MGVGIKYWFDPQLQGLQAWLEPGVAKKKSLPDEWRETLDAVLTCKVEINSW